MEKMTLWCEGRVEVEHSKKRDHSDDSSGEPRNKRSKKEKDIEDALKSLQEKHSELRLWARMYVNGIHADLETPPDVPAITGHVVKRKESNRSLAEALAGAATAVTKMLVPPKKFTDGISPYMLLIVT